MALKIDGPTEGEFRWSIDVVDPVEASELHDLVAAAAAEHKGGTMQLWLHDVDSASQAAVESIGFEAYRDLWQLRRPLPAPPSGIITRGFAPDDTDELVSVNNRAFSWHPEQGGLTATALRLTMTEPWFEPDGVRLLHIDDRLAGFCWAKIHTDTQPHIGEIYVIAVDPDFHGRGLGGPMTLAGLEWLAAQSINEAMLYVENDNGAANAVYDRLGFIHHHTDRAYRLKRP